MSSILRSRGGLQKRHKANVELGRAHGPTAATAATDSAEGKRRLPGGTPARPFIPQNDRPSASLPTGQARRRGRRTAAQRPEGPRPRAPGAALGPPRGGRRPPPRSPPSPQGGAVSLRRCPRRRVGGAGAAARALCGARASSAAGGRAARAGPTRGFSAPDDRLRHWGCAVLSPPPWAAAGAPRRGAGGVGAAAVSPSPAPASRRRGRSRRRPRPLFPALGRTAALSRRSSSSSCSSRRRRRTRRTTTTALLGRGGDPPPNPLAERVPRDARPAAPWRPQRWSRCTGWRRRRWVGSGLVHRPIRGGGCGDLTPTRREPRAKVEGRCGGRRERL